LQLKGVGSSARQREFLLSERSGTALNMAGYSTKSIPRIKLVYVV
jgi:hypothetical protein